MCAGVLFHSAPSVSLSQPHTELAAGPHLDFFAEGSFMVCVCVCLSRQLLHNSNLSSSNGSTEDLFRDSIDSCDMDISEKVWVCLSNQRLRQ